MTFPHFLRNRNKYNHKTKGKKRKQRDHTPAVMPTIEQGKLRQAYQTSRGCFVGNLQEQLNFKDESSSEIRVQGTIGTEASDDTRFGGRESGEALAQAEGGRSNQI